MIQNVNTLERGRQGPVLLNLDAVVSRTRFKVGGAKSGRVVVQARGTGTPSGNMFVKRSLPGGAIDFATPKTIPAAGGYVDLSSDDLRGEDAIEVGRDAGALSNCWAEVTVMLDYDVAPVVEVSGAAAAVAVRQAVAQTGGSGLTLPGR